MQFIYYLSHYYYSDFVFDRVKWPRVQMEADFLKLSKTFNAVRSIIRAPTLDPKYKIAVLASNQVHNLYSTNTWDWKRGVRCRTATHLVTFNHFHFLNITSVYLWVSLHLLYVVVGPLSGWFITWMAGWKTPSGYHLCN